MANNGSSQSDRASLKTVHNIAAACQLWARTRPESTPVYQHSKAITAGERDLSRDSFALGFIDRLCQVFRVDASDRELITYIYLLIDGHGARALHRLKSLSGSLTTRSVGVRIKEGARDADRLLNSVLGNDLKVDDSQRMEQQ